MKRRIQYRFIVVVIVVTVVVYLVTDVVSLKREVLY